MRIDVVLDVKTTLGEGPYGTQTSNDSIGSTNPSASTVEPSAAPPPEVSTFAKVRLVDAPPVTATLPPVFHEPARPNTDANQATRTLDPHHAAKPESAQAAPAPKKIGRFEVRRVLGEGGFGIVYEAYDPQLD